jgi:hypothetical protein
MGGRGGSYGGRGGLYGAAPATASTPSIGPDVPLVNDNVDADPWNAPRGRGGFGGATRGRGNAFPARGGGSDNYDNGGGFSRGGGGARGKEIFFKGPVQWEKSCRSCKNSKCALFWITL